MANSNRERQKRFRESKTQSGESRIACWLPEEDLQRLIEIMSKNKNSKTGHSDVISEALKELEVSMTPAPHRNFVRHGLLYMNDRQINNEPGEK